MTQAAEAKTAAPTLATSQALDNDLHETSDRPTKRPRIAHKEGTHAPTMGTEASRQAVLDTNELLEGILSFLPPIQLFADQRVCKRWRDVIASSPGLQKKMFLRVDEVPRETWELMADYYDVDGSPRIDLRRCDSGTATWPWRLVTPTSLSPLLETTNYDDEEEEEMSTYDKNCVAFRLTCDLAIGSRSSVLDTYFSNPPCYDFTLDLDFDLEPAIPRHSGLMMSPVRIQTKEALKVGEALDRAMAIHTNVTLCENYFDRTVKSKTYRDVTVTEVIDKLQREYGSTAILGKFSVIVLRNVCVPSEQQRAEVDAAYVKMKQGAE